MLLEKQRVTLTWDSSRQGIVLRPGPEVSGVRWDYEPRMMFYYINEHLKEI